MITCPFGAITVIWICLLLIGLETETAPHLGHWYLVIPFSSCHAVISRWQLWHTSFTGLPICCITYYPPNFPNHTTVLDLSNFVLRGWDFHRQSKTVRILYFFFGNGAITEELTVIHAFSQSLISWNQNQRRFSIFSSSLFVLAMLTNKPPVRFFQV